MAWLWSVCLILAAVLASASANRPKKLQPEDTAYEMLTEYMEYYPHPKLPYAYDALEPFMSQATLEVHHTGHHRAYCTKMNTALKEWREEDPESELAKSSLYEIMKNLSNVPEKWRTAIRNNGGGFINHIFYFVVMRNKVHTVPRGRLAQQVNDTFGSYDQFMEEFGAAGAKLFGSGYVWLVEDEESNISIVTTVNQDCPITDGLYPLLVMDVWEHAYYLQYKNRRDKYITNWWSVTHWAAASRIQEWWRDVRGYEEEGEDKDVVYDWENEVVEEEVEEVGKEKEKEKKAEVEGKEEEGDRRPKNEEL